MGQFLPERPIMAKRYHQSVKDRMAESRGMERHEMMSSRERYAGMEPRRRQEMEDAGMINEDHSAIANMPQGVMMKPYSKPYNYLPEGLDDTIRGIDNQMDNDDIKKRGELKPRKF